MNSVVIFGGAGFIGLYFAKYILEDSSIGKVYIVDSESIEEKHSEFRMRLFDCDPRIEYRAGDVREEVDWHPLESVALIANFAAIHREPGHEDLEYYETNLLGAENVCAFAEKVNCNRLVFTSSISPYGPSEQVKTEASLPVPVTAYGGSKLVAEKIHQTWQARDEVNRRLVIVRPGVVFGPGEGGNVSRLIKAVLGRYFFYMGNRNTRKAGTYVKELCRAIYWVLENQDKHGEKISLFNMSMNPGPSIEEYVNTICNVAGVKRWVPNISYRLLLTCSYFIEFFAKPLNISHPFSPVRIRKLVRSNNIRPQYLLNKGYSYKYSLRAAFEDWKKECPEEWS
ncbi:NAD-dependent epimerase/dehydratase family protein [Marinobacter sp. BW6]|uniref:NAD-dependent epimerase/dehydratase family protein n=1 Tax=Marinobacter sp. BW6 TaxID=2592624 RepID=UPI0011DE6B8A|nr:NAD(P)-dependent oxidoreductase [Marinobacter sp. BW6]TYC58042.1 NAD-dependent epimerase/dehydratase family protein [Marinobacter sp. BW6]